MTLGVGKTLKSTVPLARFKADESVLHRAPVRPRHRRADRIAGSQIGHGETHVVGRTRDVGLISRRLIVDPAHVHQGAVGVDDVHVRRGLGIVSTAHDPGGIEQNRRRRRAATVGQIIGLGRADLALLARRRGDHRKPDIARSGRLLLQGLHIARGVVLDHERAIVIRPLQNDLFACQTRKAPGLARGIDNAEVRRRGTDLGRRDGDAEGQCGRQGDGAQDEGLRKNVLHGCSPFSLVGDQ
ncbi:hypothetical protein THIOKS1550017 [Thiocapsa sp. KS1]|nr:hypothetical protein THIOKS1550017 [Thiocapsa sp. KS1]